MPESLREGVVPREWWMWLLSSAIALSAQPPCSAADALSSRVRACAAETDPARRLACYDKDVAPFAEAAPAPESKRETTGECCAESTRGAVQPDSKSNARPDTAQQDRSQKSDEHKQTQESGAEKVPRHLTARVVSIENLRGALVLHLDNGQAWEQVQEATADMNLRAGDTVTIDKNLLGSYWLGGRSEGVMKVKRKE